MNAKTESYDKLIDDLPPMDEVTTPDTVDMNKPPEPTLPTQIANEVQRNAILFTDGKERAYVHFKVGSHKETWPINSRRFSSWLYDIGMPLNEDNIIGPECITSVRKYLEAMAYGSSCEIELYNRVAKSEGDFWYDLTNNEWEAVKINSDGWKLENKLSPLFIRLSHQKPQTIPTSGSDIWDLFEFIKVPDNKKLLILVYLISCFIPDIPHPVPIIFGPAGAGKSMTMEFIRDIIDPSRAPRLKMPKGDKEIVQVFDHHYATFFDNLDVLPKWFSDIVCRAVTGEGSEFRALYSDDGAIIRSYRRCVCLNGINVASTQADLLDRSILIQLKKFPDGVRVEEEKLRRNFELTKPGLLGGIFDIIVKAKRIYPTVNLEKLPRMADFAKWGYAIAEALGGYGNNFLKLYLEDETERVNETVYQSDLATAIVAFINDKKIWRGTAADLLEELKITAERLNIPTNSKSWPKNPAWFSRKLNQIESTIEHMGISVDRSRDNGQRYITLKVGENADRSVMLSPKVDEPLKNEIQHKNVTGNLTLNDSNFDSKNLKESVYSESDSNDRMDSKTCDLKSSQTSYDKTSKKELWNKSVNSDDESNDILQESLIKSPRVKNGVL